MFKKIVAKMMFMVRYFIDNRLLFKAYFYSFEIILFKPGKALRSEEELCDDSVEGRIPRTSHYVTVHGRAQLVDNLLKLS